MNEFIRFLGEYVWYFVGALALIAVVIIIICIASRTRHRKNLNIIDKQTECVEEKSQIIEERIPIITENKSVQTEKSEPEITEPVQEITEPEPEYTEPEISVVSETLVTPDIINDDDIAAEKEVKKEIKIKNVEIQTKQRQYNGKWRIKKVAEDEFIACLYASNGELMLSSEVYKEAKGATFGIETIKRNLIEGSTEIHIDKNKKYFFTLKSANSRLLCVSSVYESLTACENAIESVKRFSKSATVQSKVVEEMVIAKYEPKIKTFDVKEGYAGKWKINEDDGGFMASLHASNGEILLRSEIYASETSAKNAVKMITKNIEACNFVIECDKNKNYFFKLRNDKKTVLCIGETYETKPACESAIESVRRFSQSAKLLF